jgi:outer membrane protein assembly factor BamB
MKRIVAGLVLVMLVAIAAYAVVNLQLVWSDLTFHGGPRNEAQSVAFNRNRVIVGEVLGLAGGCVGVTVRGYNATTGNVAWEDSLDGNQVFVDALGSDALAVINRGSTLDPNLTIRSYNQGTGDIQWTQTARIEAPQAAIIRGGKIILAGFSHDSPTAPAKGILIVLDRGTGVELWRATLEEVPPRQAQWWDVDGAGTHLVTVGSTENPVSPVEQKMIIRNYRLRDGHLRWETIEPNGIGTQVQIANGLAYVSGRLGMAFVAAYRLTNGSRLWSTRIDAPGVRPMLATETRIVSATETFVEALDPFTGGILWQTPVPQESGRDQLITKVTSVGSDVVALYTSASSLNVFPPDNQLVIRVFDIGGNLVLEDKGDHAPRAVFFDVATSGNRFVAVGTLSGVSGGAFVRAYEVQDTGSITP